MTGTTRTFWICAFAREGFGVDGGIGSVDVPLSSPWIIVNRTFLPLHQGDPLSPSFSPLLQMPSAVLFPKGGEAGFSLKFPDREENYHITNTWMLLFLSLTLMEMGYGMWKSYQMFGIGIGN